MSNRANISRVPTTQFSRSTRRPSAELQGLRARFRNTSVQLPSRHVLQHPVPESCNSPSNSFSRSCGTALGMAPRTLLVKQDHLFCTGIDAVKGSVRNTPGSLLDLDSGNCRLPRIQSKQEGFFNRDQSTRSGPAVAAVRSASPRSTVLFSLLIRAAAPELP